MILKNIYYYFKFGESRGRIYMPKLDILLVYLENIGIKEIESCNVVNKKITFKDNSVLIFYCDKYIDYMCIGTMDFNGGKQLSWQYRQPSYETLYKYKKAIYNYENVDYSEYIPLTVTRKEKLYKLKKRD